MPFLPLGNETILVVDDEVGSLKNSKEILAKNGCTVFCAENAKQALEVVEKESIDLILSDVIMPGMDGYQLATVVERSHPNIKVQMARGFSEAQKTNLVNPKLYEQRFYRPYTTGTLLKTVRQLLDEYNKF